MKNPHNARVGADCADERVSRVPVFQIDRMKVKEIHGNENDYLNYASRDSGVIDDEDEHRKTKAGNERSDAGTVLPRSRVFLLAGITADEEKAEREKRGKTSD